jgi:uncharacterized protein YaiI (UPF0178 family)
VLRIWVDADACPNPIKAVIQRAAERRCIETMLVANHHVRTAPSRYVTSLQVPAGFDVADAAIADRLEPGDLVVTADVPLAAEVVRLGATALNPRGTLYTADNVRDHLARRDLMEQLRDNGTVTSRQNALSKTDVQAFANELDRFLARHGS